MELGRGARRIDQEARVRPVYRPPLHIWALGCIVWAIVLGLTLLLILR
jgi:hypothetical protein